MPQSPRNFFRHSRRPFGKIVAKIFLGTNKPQRPASHGDGEEVLVTSQNAQKVAIARTSIALSIRSAGACRIEDNVYGATMLMTQVARTFGWDKEITHMAVTSWILLLVNLIIQGYLLKLLAQEQEVFDAFKGQMFLCNFGSNAENCPGPGCLGPFGTQTEPSRLRDWFQVSLRAFYRDSLKTVLPEKAAEIDAYVDPGEYGVQSHACRLMCCFLFMIHCFGELFLIYKMALLLYKIPTAGEPWMVPKQSESGEEEKRGLLDDVELRIAGMPLAWKIVNVLFIILPKVVLWKVTVQTGIAVLMESTSISDSVGAITNSVGLTLILNIDELIGEALLDAEIQEYIDACEDFPLYDVQHLEELSSLTEDELLERYTHTQHSFEAWGVCDVLRLFPQRLLEALSGASLFVFLYYRSNCIANQEDADLLVSKPINEPASLSYTWLNFILPDLFPIEEGAPVWQMAHGQTGEH